MTTVILDLGPLRTPDYSDSYYLPHNTEYHDSKLQFIITGSQLSAIGLTSGKKIASLGMRPTELSTVSLNLSIRLKNVTISTLNGWETAGLTQVFKATVPASAYTVNSFYDYVFSTPFEYTGNNLLVEIIRDNSSWKSGGLQQLYTVSPSLALGIYHESEYTGTFDTAPSENIDFIPELRLTFDEEVTPPDPTKTPIAIQKIATATGVIDVPIYAISDVTDSSVRIQTSNGIGCYHIVEPSNDTPFRIMTQNGIKGISLVDY